MGRKKRSRSSRTTKPKPRPEKTVVVADAALVDTSTPDDAVAATMLENTADDRDVATKESDAATIANEDLALGCDQELSRTIDELSKTEASEFGDENVGESEGESQATSDAIIQENESAAEDDSALAKDHLSQVELASLDDESSSEPRVGDDVGRMEDVAAVSISHASEQDVVLRAIEDNTRLLEGLIQRLGTQPNPLQIDHSRDHEPGELGDEHSPGGDEAQQASWQVDELEQRNRWLEEENNELERTIHRLQLQLESGDGDDRDAASGTSGVGDDQTTTQSWEQQKAAILAQMEADQFDAENFIETLASSADDEDWSIDDDDDPSVVVEQVFASVDRLRTELTSARDEIVQLKRTLAERSDQCIDNETGTATGAAAIANLLGQDELVVEERERLKQLQVEWEEKFRKIEVETSLERAKLARERQELADRLAVAESELIQVRRDNQTAEETGHANRRWLAKLGLDKT